MPESRKQQEREEPGGGMSTRERILEVALEVFAERGLHGATMTDIAKRAGLTGGALYRYFANKDEIFYAVVESRSQAFSALDMVRDLVPELEPKSALKFIAQGMFAFFFSQMDFMRMVVGESVKNPEMSRPFFEKMLTPARELVRDCVRIWKEKDLLREDVDPTLATVSFLGIVGYAMVERSLFGDSELEERELGALAEDLSSVFLQGILKER